MINAVSSNPASTSSPAPMPSGATVAPPVMQGTPGMETMSAGPDSSNNKSRKRKSNSISPKMILGGLFLLLLMVGGVSGFVLMNQSQDPRNQASTGPMDPYSTPAVTPVISGYPVGSATICGTSNGHWRGSNCQGWN